MRVHRRVREAIGAAPGGERPRAGGASQAADAGAAPVGDGRRAFSSGAVATIAPVTPIRTTGHAMPPTGLEIVYLEQRDRLIRFLKARGAGDAAEDLVHDLWIKVSARTTGPIANPLAYLCRAADLLMIDRYRSRRQAERREQAWEDGRHDDGADGWNPERAVGARQEAARVAALLSTMGARKAAIFRRVRIDGVPQRNVAAEFGVSLSTVENDLREVARALLRLKDEIA
jgi:RNA polymerase sigma-70 factor (ECF subfamily)